MKRIQKEKSWKRVYNQMYFLVYLKMDLLPGVFYARGPITEAAVNGI